MSIWPSGEVEFDLLVVRSRYGWEFCRRSRRLSYFKRIEEIHYDGRGSFVSCQVNALAIPPWMDLVYMDSTPSPLSVSTMSSDSPMLAKPATLPLR